jgi:hypothetical protein
MGCSFPSISAPIVVEDFNGSFSAEHGIGRKNQAYYDLYTDPAAPQLARGLKTITSAGALGAVSFA